MSKALTIDNLHVAIDSFVRIYSSATLRGPAGGDGLRSAVPQEGHVPSLTMYVGRPQLEHVK